MDLQPICEGWGETREGGRAWAEAALLHATHFRAATVRSYSIEDVKEARGVLIKRDFKLGCGPGVGKVHRVVVDVKGAVRRRTRDCGEDAAPIYPVGAAGTYVGAQVVLIRKNRLAHSARRQGTVCAQITCVARELQIAIGADQRTVKARPVKEDREWERNRGGAIIAMVACVSCPSNDPSKAGGGLILATGWRRSWRRCWRRGGCRSWTDALEPEGDVAEVPRSGEADECALAGCGVDCVDSVAVSRRREQNAIGGAHTQTIILLVHRYGVDAVGINRRDGVQRCAIKAVIVRELIKRAIGSKTDPAAITGTGIAYERRSGRAEVDGVQKASVTKRVRGDPVEHASARLEAQIADTERRPVFVNRAYGGNQAAGIGIDLDQRAGAATRYS